MENNVFTAEDMEWNEGIRKRLHKLRVTLNIVILSVFGLLAIVGYYIYGQYGFEHALGQMAALALFVLLPAMAVTCSCVCDSLDHCYRHYRCKACGHIHRPKLEELKGLENSADSLYCPKCNKHKKAPWKNNAEYRM